ncbi:MAG: cell division protein FtsA [Deltaproteobacteria bacterium]|nr:cell division protein FtsA [Deltaproteobacteria bacterium]
MSNIFAIDLGTTKFCLASITYDKTFEKAKLDTVSVLSAGMKRGMLSDFFAAQKSLSSLIELAEKEFDFDINTATLGVSGTHLKSKFVTCQIPIDSDHLVNSRLLDKIQTQIKIENQVDGREFIHISPYSYQIDSREWIVNPLGFSGSSLKSKHFIIEADKYYLADLVRLCNSCGISVSSLISEQYASSQVTIPPLKKELGVVLLDIGGGTTDGMVFLNGKPSKVFTVNIGGQLMTNDLSIGFGIPFDEAERIKILGGISSDHELTCHAVDFRGSTVNIDPRKASQILKARIEELAIHVNKEIEPFKGLLQGGIILTGGGSELPGMVSLFANVMHDVVVAKADPVFGGNENTGKIEASKFASKYATVLGLLYYEFIRQRNNGKTVRFKNLNSFFSSFASWLKELT